MKFTEQTICDHVVQWQRRLGLTHWTIEVIIGDVDNEDAILEIQRHENAHRAVIHVAEWLATGDDPPTTSEEITAEYVEASVVHELLHAAVRDLTFIVRDDIDGLLGQPLHELLMRTMNRAEEQLVDGLAQALVRAWPRG